MRVTHTMTVRAKCPVDKLPDVYEVVFTTDRVVKVEEIVAAVQRLSGAEIFQEDLTVKLARELGIGVKTTGYHSGIRTEVTA